MIDTNGVPWRFTYDHPLCSRCARPETETLCFCVTESAETAAKGKVERLADYERQKVENQSAERFADYESEKQA